MNKPAPQGARAPEARAQARVNPVSRVLALLVFIHLLLLPRSASSILSEPQGFAKAHFRMSVEQVKRVLPQLKLVGDASKRKGLALAIYRLENQSVYGFKSCTVGFEFAADQLYKVTFDCGRSKKVLSVLRKNFGEPSLQAAYGVFWNGDKTVISLNPRAMTFGFMDRDLNQRVQRELLTYVLSNQRKARASQAQGSPSPAATPQ